MTTLAFTVVEPTGVRSPLIAGQVCRISDTARGSLAALRGQLAVIRDAHRNTTDGPLWLDVIGTCRDDSPRYPGHDIGCVMRDGDQAHSVAQWLPGEYRVRECLDVDCIDPTLRRNCYVVTHTPWLAGRPSSTSTATSPRPLRSRGPCTSRPSPRPCP